MAEQTRYEVKERAETQVKIQVHVAPDEVRERIDSVYQRYSTEVRVPGFRKGHVPRAYLDSRFGRELFREEAHEELQRDHLPKALTELSLYPVSVPEIELISTGEAEPLVFEASFAVLPELELPDYKGLEVSAPPESEATEDDVAGALGEVQRHFATLGEKEGDTVSDGDIVRVKEKGQEWDTRAEEDNPVTCNLIGQSVGSTVEIAATLGDDKSVKTALTIVGLRQVIEPEVDDELAKDAGFETLEELKADIRTRITEDRVERRGQLIEARLLDTLVEKTEIPLPDAFVDDLVNEEVERIKKSLARPQTALTFEEYLEKREMTEDGMRSEIREAVSLRVRRELVLRDLAKDAGIEISDDELSELAKADAASAGEDPIRFVARLKAEDHWSDYRSNKINGRVLALLREAAVVKDEEAS